MADVTVVEQNVIKVVRVDDNQFNIITLATQGPAGADGNDGVDFGKNNALVGSDGVTVTSGSNTDTISGFQTEFVSASGSLQTQIDSLSAAGVSSVNAVTGAVLVTGTQNVTTQTVGQTITITGPDLSTYATSAEVDSDVAAVSGTLSAEIDSDISTHAANASAHHAKYTDAEAISALEPTTSALAASGVVTDSQVTANRNEFVSASGSLEADIDTRLQNVVEDTTPELGGNLGGGGFDISNVGTITATVVTGTTGQFGGTISSQLANLDRVRVGNGSASLPSYSFISDTDTGFWLNGAILDFVVGGTQAHRFGVNTIRGRDRASTAAPTFTFIGDVDTGMGHPSADTLNLITGGAARLTLSAASANFSTTVTGTSLLTGGPVSGQTGNFSDTLTVNDYTLPSADGSADQVMVTDGAGSLTFQDQSGGGASLDNNLATFVEIYN